MTNDDRAPQGPRAQPPTVRPRWVRGGLLLALIGAATLGLGIAGTWWWPSVVGAVLLLLGVAAGFAGGMMYDAVPTFSAREEMHPVATGDVHEGVAPGGQVTSPAARRTAREATRSTRTSSPRHPRPSTSGGPRSPDGCSC